MKAYKRSLYRIHKWCSLLFLIPFIILAVTGLIIAFKPTLPVHVEGRDGISLAEAMKMMNGLGFGEEFRRINYTPTHFQFYFSDNDGLRLVTVERSKGAIVEDIKNAEYDFYYFSQTLHESLALSDLGTHVVAWSGLGLFIVLLSGFFLWKKQSLVKQIKGLLISFKLSPRSIHYLSGVVFLVPLAFAGITGTLIHYHDYIFKDRLSETHVVALSCSFKEQLNVANKINYEKSGKFWGCKAGSPYISVFNENRFEKYTPIGKIFQHVDPKNWSNHSYLRSMFFIDLHSGNKFGAFRNVYNILIGLGLIILTLTGGILWWKKNRGSFKTL